MRKVFRVWIAGSLLCAAVSSPGLAQEDPPVAPDAATSEEPQAAFGDQVVVTAGAVEQKQRHSTASVEVIERT